MTPRAPESTPEIPTWLHELDSECEQHHEPTSATTADPTKASRIDDRPEIKWGTELHRIVVECSDALANDPLIYQRSFQLVTVVGAEREDPKRGLLGRGAPIIRPITAASLATRMTKYVKILGRAKPSAKAIALKDAGGPTPAEEWREIYAPQKLISALLDDGNWSNIRPLVGISETPFLRPDGTICQERGYDAATGYICAPSVDYPPIPEQPTQEQAEAALAQLVDVFREFPYSNETGPFVAIAMILTILARPAIDGSIPAFVFEASTRGSGKTLQAHAISLIALGRYAAPANYPEDDAELEKMLGSYALAGARMILLDNVTRIFGGAPIDKTITARDMIEMRVLGQSEIRVLRWSAVMGATGNNMVIAEDMQRRCLVSRLESPLENPEDRTDLRDLPAFCRTNRAQLVTAALTVLRSYCSHGRPDTGCARWGSFEEFAALIPHAIRFAGGPDVMLSRPRGENAGSDETLAMGVVLREIPRLSDEPITSKTLASLLWPADYSDEQPPDGWEGLREAIEVLAPNRNGRHPEPKAIGERFRRMTGRVIDGACLRSRISRSGVREWYVGRAGYG